MADETAKIELMRKTCRLIDTTFLMSMTMQKCRHGPIFGAESDYLATMEMIDRHDRPMAFCAADVSKPNRWDDIEAVAVLRACISARVALAELAMTSRAVASPDIVAGAMVLLEARDSVAIDGPDVGLRRLLRNSSFGDGVPDGDSLAVRKYGQGLKCRLSPTPVETVTARERQADPLVRMAVEHAMALAARLPGDQTQHLRLAAARQLMTDGLIDRPILNLSRYFLRSSGDYRRLAEQAAGSSTASGGVPPLPGPPPQGGRGTAVWVQEGGGDWEPWVLYVLNGVKLTARWSRLKVQSIQNLMTKTATDIRLGAPKVYSRGLAEAIFAEPYCRIGTLVERGVAKRQTASVYLKALAELGILEEERLGRDKAFVFRAYIALLERDDHPVGQLDLLARERA